MSTIGKIDAIFEEYFKESERKSQPDYRKTVFCKDHPGVRMVRVRSYGLIESGTAAADLNPLDHWRCPKTGCIRSYEPTMGYYWDTGEMGSRKILDSIRQPRCKAHPGTPFMYVGKVGQGRRYLCPFYKCDKRGDEILSVVVDEDVEIPKDPLIGLKKADREMVVFKSFIAASGIAIDEGSESNAEPRHPDIRCTISGKLHWFELGQIIDQEVAARTNPKRKIWDGGFGFSQETPFVYIVRDKATKTYETQSAPVDLVLHFDLHLGTKRTILEQIQKHAALLKSLVNEGPFSRVWIYDEYTKCIVWSDVRP